MQAYLEDIQIKKTNFFHDIFPLIERKNECKNNYDANYDIYTDNNNELNFPISLEKYPFLKCYGISSASHNKRFPSLSFKISNTNTQNILSNYCFFVKSKSTIDNSVLNLQIELSEMAFAIKDSKKLLDLQEDWDSEGALAVPKFVWERTANVLSMYSKWIWENKGIVLLVPSIDALADGSIDIMWNSPKARLLLNIRNNATSSEAHFYGDTYNGKNKFKGVLEDLNEVQEFFAYWLTNFIK